MKCKLRERVPSNTFVSSLVCHYATFVCRKDGQALVLRETTHCKFTSTKKNVYQVANKIRKGDTLKIEVFLQNCQASASWTCDLHVVGQNIANPFVIYFTLWVVRRTLDKG